MLHEQIAVKQPPQTRQQARETNCYSIIPNQPSPPIYSSAHPSIHLVSRQVSTPKHTKNNPPARPSIPPPHSLRLLRVSFLASTHVHIWYSRSRDPATTSLPYITPNPARYPNNTPSHGDYIHHHVCLCPCSAERERERERNRSGSTPPPSQHETRPGYFNDAVRVLVQLDHLSFEK